tara:strand:+ start:4390 stop:5118 length:729 start_codon:yes stop_codon:yes gene_type:complete
MPIFPGAVRHNNENAAILDLTKNQVVGIGVFDVLATSEQDEARDDLHANLRTKGYTATVRSNNTTYVYTTDSYDDDSWIDTSNWSIIGGSSLPTGIDVDDVLTYNGSAAAWSNTITTKTLTVKDHSTSPGACEVVFSRRDVGFATQFSSIMGEIRAEGFMSDGVKRTGTPSIRFIASGSNNSASHQDGGIQFYTSSSTGTEKTFELFSDKKVALAKNTTAPKAVAGGFYYNLTEDNYYVGKK